MINKFKQLIWYDKIIVGWFMFALYFAVMMDLINSLMPMGKITKESLDTLVWPPSFMRDVFLFWGEFADPMILANPLWIQVFSAYSQFVHAPIYVASIYFMLNGRHRVIRTPLLVWCGAMLTIAVLFHVSALCGPILWRSPRPIIYVLGYGSFFVMPTLVAFRFSDYVLVAEAPSAGVAKGGAKNVKEAVIVAEEEEEAEEEKKGATKKRASRARGKSKSPARKKK